jgi:endonuclease YncB( thermonuclease family)
MKNLLALGIIMCVAVSEAAADEWIVGGSKVIDGNALSVAGDDVVLDGILPIRGDRKCDVGKARLPCASLAVAELGRIVSNQAVNCRITSEDSRGRLVGRCFVKDLDLSAELIALGLAEPASGDELRTVLGRAGDADFAEPNAQGGPPFPLPASEVPGATQPAPDRADGQPLLANQPTM